VNFGNYWELPVTQPEGIRALNSSSTL